jgi:NAD(P)H-nitrite reductase large subunit
MRPILAVIQDPDSDPLENETAFHYLVGEMSSAVLAEPVRCGRAMTRCECSGVPFEEIARRVCDEGQSLEKLQAETGCGRLCTACLPDLHDHLSARG